MNGACFHHAAPDLHHRVWKPNHNFNFRGVSKSTPRRILINLIPLFGDISVTTKFSFAVTTDGFRYGDCMLIL